MVAPTTEKHGFTKDYLSRLEPPDAGRRFAYDAKTRGLCVQITSAGAKTFYVYRKVQGRPQRIRIGPVADLSIEQARKRAEVILADIAAGRNPQAAKRARRSEPTFGDMFGTYFDSRIRPEARTCKEIERRYTKHLEGFAARKASELTPQDVSTLHAKIGRNNGRIIANRVINDIRAAYAFMAEQGYVGLGNPASKTRRFKEQSRDRFLNGDELTRLFDALAGEPQTTIRDAILVGVFVGARKSNYLGMRWEDVDLDRGLWRISATESKNREPLVVILPKPIVGLLNRRREDANGSPWVFPSSRGDGPVVDLRKTWLRIIERAGIKDVRLHDLRRTLGSWLAANNVALPIIGKVLGHRDLGATAVYARLNVDSVRDSVETVAAKMLTFDRGKLLSPAESTAAPVVVEVWP